MKDKLIFLSLWGALLLATAFTIRFHVIPMEINQLQDEFQQLRDDNKKLTERVDKNDEYINHQLLMEGVKP